MSKIHHTDVTSLRVKKGMLSTSESGTKPVIQWPELPKKRHGEALAKNIAVASALVLCAATLRTGAIPALSAATDVVMSAATDQSLLDDQLGKLSFVSALFPEAVLVFGEGTEDKLAAPVSGGIVIHDWTVDEPYIAWSTNAIQVTASADGEVIGVYHGYGDERLVQVMGKDGLACLYGNLAEVYVATGDSVSAGDMLGELQNGADFIFEVRRDGISIDPAVYLSK